MLERKMIGPILNAVGIVLGGMLGVLRPVRLSPVQEGYLKLAMAALTVFYGLRLTSAQFQRVVWADREAVPGDDRGDDVGEVAGAVAATANHVSVLLNLDGARYFGLDDVGTHMWKAQTSSRTIAEAYDRLLAQFDLDTATLKKDLETLINRLIENRLITLIST